MKRIDVKIIEKLLTEFKEEYPQEVRQQAFAGQERDLEHVRLLFVENGSLEFQVRQALSEALQQLWAGKMPKWELAKITREQIGLIGIHHIAARGHEMLAEFEIVDGFAKRKPMTRVILGVKDLLFSGIGDIERILVRGEREARREGLSHGRRDEPGTRCPRV